VVVRYDLFDLPTAQHKAGLAGLLLQIGSMEARRLPPESIPEVVEGGPTTTSATVRFTERSVQGLFDDLYDARLVEVEAKGKAKGGFRVEPAGHFLRDHLPRMDPGKDWHKLWRNMVMAIPRGIHKTRQPFVDRAEGKPCSEGPKVWRALQTIEGSRHEGEFYTEELSGALWLGAQAKNAEAVPFRGRSEQNLLLHFWPLTVLVFVPQRIDNEGKKEFVGYVVAVPEVADLEAFCHDYPLLLRELRPEPQGYRPAGAVVDLPAQGALEFLANLGRLAQRAVEKTRARYSLSAVEYFHAEKGKRVPKSLGAGRVVPGPGLLDRYFAIAGGPGRPSPYRNPLFRAGLLLALLRGQDWYEGLAPALAERPWPFFLRGERAPRSLPPFAADAAAKFAAEREAYAGDLEVHAMSKDNAAGPLPRPPLSVLVHRLVRTYALRKAEERSGLKWKDIRARKGEGGRPDVPPAFREARQKVAADAFLALRSRREQDFVDYFTATVCSVGQFLPEPDFAVVADALLTRPEDVKTLTLLALSANS
jgi:CRISPR-associated protein Cmx8